jgi:hypothetical protein
MTAYFAITPIRISAQGSVRLIYPGDVVDDSRDDVVSMMANGAALALASDPYVAAAAAIALKRRGQGADAIALESLMRTGAANSASASVQAPGGSLGGASLAAATVKQLDGTAGVASVPATEVDWGPNVKSLKPTGDSAVQTVSAALTTIATIAIPNTSQTRIDVIVSAYRPGNGDAATWALTVAYVRNGAGPVIMGAAPTDPNARGTNAGAPPAGWPTPVFTISGNNILVQAQDTAWAAAGDNANWYAYPQIIKAA